MELVLGALAIIGASIGFAMLLHGVYALIKWKGW
jgi:hypothetical protein